MEREVTLETEEDGEVFTLVIPPEITVQPLTVSHQTQPSQPTDDIPPPKPDFSAPPPYDIATKLPTYEEVQREKHLQSLGQSSRVRHPVDPTAPGHRPPALAFLAIDTDGTDADGENNLLGTDLMFSMAFIVAFLFNWIGFLLLMCFCHTVAARYGALSGFGLSLTKWTLIVKHSTDLASHENSWLWWLIMAFDCGPKS